MIAPRRPVLLYDADCRVCCFAARTIVRLDRNHQLAFLPLQDASAAPLLEQLPRDEQLATWRLAAGERAPVGYGAGAPALLQAMRVTRPVGRLLGLAPAGALDVLYGVVARNRGRLGKLVPDGPAPRRFP